MSISVFFPSKQVILSYLDQNSYTGLEIEKKINEAVADYFADRGQVNGVEIGVASAINRGDFYKQLPNEDTNLIGNHIIETLKKCSGSFLCNACWDN